MVKLTPRYLGSFYFFDADYGVVVTNNTYTPAAKKLADKNEIILLNDSELERLLKLCE